MYIPDYHRIEDRALALSFMQENPFATLVSNAGNGLLATHVPVLIKELSGSLEVTGHMARANRHWESFEQGGEALVIFHGPHAYISPTLYESRESVPTWNYAAVHAYGSARTVHSEAELTPLLDELISHFDAQYQQQWISLSREYRSRMMRHIVGFKIRVSRLETKFKLSQNRTRRDQESVIQSLARSDDSTITGVARLMRAQGLGLK